MQEAEEQGIFASEGEQRNMVMVPEGAHLARCFQVVDSGTHDDEYKGQKRVRRQVRLFWEIPEETITIEGVTTCLTISKAFTLSLNEKAKLREWLVSWRGRSFTPEELKRFNLTKLLGAPCILNIVQREAQNDPTRKNNVIVSISAVTKGSVVGQAVHEPRWYSVSMGRSEAFKSFPEWLRKQIEQCHEWTKAPDAVAEPEVPEEDQSDVPF